ncbi:hypothetical protein [Marichromatium gracile]|uniref:Secreted protein n=1 Tax=Marichromatium gracile TaxID=1048 RepID=A0ABR5VKM9_MARGR|nr:hypothetical protein [Marichromatium gracile]KXX66234.1 hypothetical protein AY586_06595 [Marichromatium gracile]
MRRRLAPTLLLALDLGAPGAIAGVDPLLEDAPAPRQDKHYSTRPSQRQPAPPPLIMPPPQIEVLVPVRPPPQPWPPRPWPRPWPPRR